MRKGWWSSRNTLSTLRFLLHCLASRKKHHRNVLDSALLREERVTGCSSSLESRHDDTNPIPFEPSKRHVNSVGSLGAGAARGAKAHNDYREKQKNHKLLFMIYSKGLTEANGVYSE
jgi:hypothetical protein